jgi:hypothetical protein
MNVGKDEPIGKAVLTNESLNKQGYGDHIEYKQIEDILSVFFQECGDGIQFELKPGFVLIQDWFDVETGHPGKKEADKMGIMWL